MAKLLAVAVATVLFSAGPVLAWGDRTHPAIVRLAIETLPEDVRAAFRRHTHDLERYSNEPDTVLRRRLGHEESIRHFIDLDGYMPPPFEGFPRDYEAAVKRIGKRRVEKYGVLPWVIVRKTDELRRELAANRGNDWVRVAGHLAHYVGDAYQPLHLTVDYDGQLSGSRGIHERYENDVIDSRIDSYERSLQSGLGAAQPIAKLRDAIFADLFRSYPLKDEILAADRAARSAGRPEGDAYNADLERRLADMTGGQIRRAAAMLGSVWLTAWREARR